MNTYVINRFLDKPGYQTWKFDPNVGALFTLQPGGSLAQLDPSDRVCSVGNYFLRWTKNKSNSPDGNFDYQLIPIDTESPHGLNEPPIQKGSWPVKKFYGYRNYYSENPNEKEYLNLLPMATFVMFYVFSKGRGTYELFNFDPNFTHPNTSDPLPSGYTPQAGFQEIQLGHTLYPIGNYVIDRMPDGITYRLWSFDPQDPCPLSVPYLYEGIWDGLQPEHNITVLGDYLLAWNAEDLSYLLYRFDPYASNPVGLAVKSGTLPTNMEGSSELVSYQANIPYPKVSTPSPGTMDYMRRKIKNVVFYMLESRSFDNVCGWLYNQNDQLNYIGSNESYNGASTSNYNLDGQEKVYQSLFHGGKLSEDYVLDDQVQDPFHSNSDALRQLFYDRKNGYANKAKPDMGGFVQNNSNHAVMSTLSPEQLPVLNGLAQNYAISDKWFCSVPGGTDINRAFSVTGSAMNQLYSWEGGKAYQLFPEYPRRQSLWKVLWSHGINDFRIYNAMLWQKRRFTYHLYLQGQVPTIDNNAQNYTATLDQFYQDAKVGNLPKFTFLEPVWVAPNGTTSYHPTMDLVPGEKALNQIFTALKESPQWEDTLFVVTFSKNGGIYDHAAPPYGKKAWANDSFNNFEYDLFGPRVPAIFVSPWIKKNTVIRSGQETPFDSTSFPATLLSWFGIPKERWCLGERMAAAPTFEAVLQETAPRTDAPTLPNPYDKDFPES